MQQGARPLLGTGLEDEIILQYDVEKYPWREIISEILQVGLARSIFEGYIYFTLLSTDRLAMFR